MNLLRSGMVLIAVVMAFALSGCTRAEKKPSGRLQVVTTLFPLYDFSRSIAGNRAEVTLLLPPGMEPHSFEPRPDDIVRIGKAGLFIYTSRYMEPWADTVIKGVDSHRLQVIEAGRGVALLKAGEDDHDGHDDHHHAGGLDPHIWLDFANARIMVGNILEGFVAGDPANAEYYRRNAAILTARLTELDQRFRDTLATCTSHVLLHGGHYAFGYLAHRYGLEYHALSGVASDAEPSAARMASMVRSIRTSGVRYLFTEELLSPRLTETLASEAGVEVLKLHGAHNLTRDDFQRGVTFFDLMEQDLANLQKGLSCRTK